MLPVVWSRLGKVGDPTDVSCDGDGPKVGPIPLLKRTQSGFEPRSVAELEFVFGAALGRPIKFADKARALSAIADALGKNDVSRAMLITQFMWLPKLPGQQALRRAIKAESLIKGGFNPAEARDQQGRWTGGASSGADFTPLADPNLIPVQDIVIPDAVIPWLEQIKPTKPLAPTPPFPGEILPPAVGVPGIAQPRTFENPFPDDEGCKEEWSDAIQYCGRLAAEGKLGSGNYKEHGKYFQQCVRGQISERCGGNPVNRWRGA
jgi:hypothetical protein